MFREFLKAKIHKATITHANLHYNGSLSIDEEILEKSGIRPNEKIHVYNINNGKRFETYAIKGEKGSKVFGLNGAAARLGSIGDQVIIVSYCYLSDDEIKKHKARIIIMEEGNQIREIIETSD